MENISLKYKIIISIVSVAILFGSYLFLQNKNKNDIIVNNTPPPSSQEQSSKEPSPPKEVVVHISGRVRTPGIVKLPEGSRVSDSLQIAGILKDSDVDKINLAAVLNDGEKIYVPKVGEVAQSSVSSASSNPVQGSSLININTAGLQELDQIPGIGPVTAQKIIDYRASSGSFKKLEDLTKVSGIGQKTFEKIKKYIKI